MITKTRGCYHSPLSGLDWGLEVARTLIATSLGQVSGGRLVARGVGAVANYGCASRSGK